MLFSQSGESVYVPASWRSIDFEISFSCLQFLPKNEWKKVDLRYHSIKVEFFRSFLEELWIPSFAFEIIWPLVDAINPIWYIRPTYMQITSSIGIFLDTLEMVRNGFDCSGTKFFFLFLLNHLLQNKPVYMQIICLLCKAYKKECSVQTFSFEIQKILFLNIKQRLGQGHLHFA